MIPIEIAGFRFGKAPHEEPRVDGSWRRAFATILAAGYVLFSLSGAVVRARAADVDAPYVPCTVDPRPCHFYPNDFTSVSGPPTKCMANGEEWPPRSDGMCWSDDAPSSSPKLSVDADHTWHLHMRVTHEADYGNLTKEDCELERNVVKSAIAARMKTDPKNVETECSQ